MKNFKQTLLKNMDYAIFSLVLIFILVNALVMHEYLVAVIDAICGISYVFLIGKGKPIAYIIGLIGSGCYCLLSLQQALWGNLLLYALYYIPMQVIGFIQWNKNLKEGKKEVVKIKLPKKELINICIISFVLIFLTALGLEFFKDKHPILDSITTILSIAGMYMTVRRALEQWIFWIFVNAISLIMWLHVALSGAKVISIVIMWGVYLFLAFYFYFAWNKEIKETEDKKEAEQLGG